MLRFFILWHPDSWWWSSGKPYDQPTDSDADSGYRQKPEKGTFDRAACLVFTGFVRDFRKSLHRQNRFKGHDRTIKWVMPNRRKRPIFPIGRAIHFLKLHLLRLTLTIGSKCEAVVLKQLRRAFYCLEFHILTLFLVILLNSTKVR